MDEERQQKLAKVILICFSDANIIWDKPLQKYMEDDPEGYIPFTKLASLQRFRKLQASANDIKEAAPLCKSRLEVNEEGTALRRIKPFVKHRTETLEEYSIYIEGLPHDKTVQDIKHILTEHVGPVTWVHVPIRVFRGFCFVEFDDIASVQKAVDTLNQPLSDDLHLRVMSKTEYLRYKQEYLDLMEQRKQDVQALWAEYQAQEEKNAIEELPYTPGIIVLVTRLDPIVPRNSVKFALQKSGVKVAYFNYKKGIDRCHVRCETPDDAKTLATFFNKQNLKQKDKDGNITEAEPDEAIRARIISGQEEATFWESQP
ncbi:hypothetical protein BCR43DRAFT_520885 [Syncephalastrum racemosum]|uniref:RRM domain-containing protein n=1 Tax=Syncephalastrum racemosum TaxID=13706 RepID=A0A1X2HW16_SYNRA|nr:hypothetical protein BCR43DRAFT_520885 [Syncephalastrum racemosum]